MVLWSGSLSSGKLNLYLALNRAWALTESALAPRMATLSLSNFFFASRNSDASMIQPEVLALGKKKRRTRLPLKSLRATGLSSSEWRRNAGALSPGLSMDEVLRILAESKLGRRRAGIFLAFVDVFAKVPFNVLDLRRRGKDRMQSLWRCQIDSTIAGAEQRTNETASPLDPSYPRSFVRLIPRAVSDHERMGHTSDLKIEIPAKVFLTRLGVSF